MTRIIFIILIISVLTILSFGNSDLNKKIDNILRNYSESSYKFGLQNSTNTWIVYYNSKVVFVISYGFYASIFTSIKTYNTLPLDVAIKSLYTSGYYDSSYAEYGAFSIVESDDGIILVYAVKINSIDVSTKTLIHGIKEASKAVDRFSKEF